MMETLRLKRKQKCIPCHTELSSVWWGVEGRRKILDSWHRKNSLGEEPSSFVKGGAVAPLGRRCNMGDVDVCKVSVRAPVGWVEEVES